MKNIIKTRTLFGAGLTALAFSSILPSTAFAQTCAAVPTCDELGYNKTESDCSGLDALKCPFDKSKLFCGGTSGNNGGCTSPSVGDILYSDKTCSAYVISNKTAIGIVFEPDKRLAIALGSKTALWSTSCFDVPDLTNYSSSTAALSNWTGKSNTNIVVSYCAANSKSCPAFDYVISYTTDGTHAGDWYLPAFGELNAIYGNVGVLNTALVKANGQPLPDSNHWSSSERYSCGAWYENFSGGNTPDNSKYSSYMYVRPVLAF